MSSAGARIHPTAVIDAKAEVPASCRIGPYCVVGPDVTLGEECELISHVTVQGPTRLGAHNRLFPFAAVGLAPQDLKYAGEPTRLEVGDHNTIREYVTINRGTAGGGGVTRVGSHCLLMAYAHIAHDCAVGDHCILANAATLAGHVTIEEWAVVGAFCALHQFTRVGAHAYIGGGTICTRDVLPFSRTSAQRDARAYGPNAIGLERRGFSAERVRSIQRAFRVLMASGVNTTQALEKLKAEPDPGGDIATLIRFIAASQRGVIIK